MSLSTSIQSPTVTFEQPLGLFINNRFIKGVKGKTFESVNPTTEKPIVAVHEGTAEDVDIAVKVAREAFEVWSEVTPSDRGRMLTKLADLFERDIETLAAIEALDNGKALTMAKTDIKNAAGCLRYYGGWADKLTGQTIDTGPETLTYTRHEPIGVCGQIIPWNFPILIWAWKVGPAIAAGNTVIVKTAEQTPLSGLYASKLVIEAGFPPGVINVISGFGRTAGAAISTHMDIDKVAFTGSTLVGRTILQAAAKSNLKKVSLELGGKSPNIVFDDADIDNAISWSNFGIFYNHGQCCCAGSRLLVQEGIYDKFITRFKERAVENRLGDPFAPDTFQGPQISQVQFDRIMEYINQGKKEGATLVLGGERHGTKGYFIQPTVFTDVTPNMKIAQEEIFGPVIAVQKFKDEAEAIKIGNSTSYGLAAGVHTTNLNRAIRMSNALKAGTVWVNNYNMISYQAPFGGFKESGFGRELGSYALENYTQIKSVICRLTDAPFP
ncbi:aldehyde dehydrogenase domain-containing protein [Talaromyces proteolyticus]|uniref:Aldehyde dehydrogenase n=1 Tax=Talaromyces proteolyticus TaxID=1131652 RepID=A0AAD4KMV9_9EURO|nr:aldehyde dehydrogenase domain-containing protein [Talaromyces proteolyticus]KAH8695221.1 aldehyde dehydrogenase domain-containing protein [Talaromyces proteolyticus]